MAVTDLVSSQVGDRTQGSNRAVVAMCLEEPDLLAEVAAALDSRDKALVGDCTEVLTMTAQECPELVVPHAPLLPPLLNHKTTRVRWEAMHALALVAPLAPELIEGNLTKVAELIRGDRSVIVRDYAVTALGNCAMAGRGYAEAVAPILREALTLWEGKQAGRALDALCQVAAVLPECRQTLADLAEAYLEHPRGVVRKAARKLLRQ